MILYYIADRRQFPGTPAEQQTRLLAKIAEAANAGVDYIQLREKDLAGRELESLTQKAVAIVAAARRKASGARLLINSRSDVALACGADGVHLTGNDIPARDARALWMSVAPEPLPVIGVSCHSVEDVRKAEAQWADFAVLAPIFEKAVTGAPGIGIASLEEACHAVRIPVLALGGVTRANAHECAVAGAAGIAGIRLFQENDIGNFVRELKQE